MPVRLIVTLNGVDRRGIVAGLAERARACGASWQESRFGRLAGRFAGIVRLDVPEASLDALERSIRELATANLHVTVERADSESVERAESESASNRRRLALELVGQDRPGIVRDVSSVLARHGVNIEELETEVESASMSGELLFHARAALALPEDADLEALRGDLEQLANELMVDLHIDAERGSDE
ncbi:MAG TPA: ACT domain-containing protein [Gammaproteobacteria bacterium]|nr:ACT domain-containing protein [Gammaproteobacteria bacterium]